MKRNLFLTILAAGIAAVGGYLALGDFSAHANNQVKLFSHSSHYGANGGGKIKNCDDCHSYSPKDANFGRPGHSPCVTCHVKEDFSSTNATSEFCKNCHSGDGYKLRQFPDPRKGFVALENFSHKNHLDTGGKTFQQFGKVSCDNCHDVNNKDGRADMPTHKVCGQCHGDSAGAQAAKPFLTSRAKQTDCLGCHSDATKDKTMRAARPGSWEQNSLGNANYSDDVVFFHQKHLSHPGAKQACKECHDGVEDSTDNKFLHVPTMTSCAKCHNDSGKVTAAKVMDKCDACHKIIRKKEKPQEPLHYGKGKHYAGAKRPSIYCAYCHDKNTAAFPVKEVYKNTEACEGCHKSEGVPWPIGPEPGKKGNIIAVVDKGDRTKGRLQNKNGVYSSIATAFDFKQIDNVAAPLDQVDAQDADLIANANIDTYGYVRENFGASVSLRFDLDAGQTPAFSPFADQFNLDQQPRDDRGRFDFDRKADAFVAEDFDRTQTASLLVYRAFAELRDQKVGSGDLKADLRVGRQSIFDAAEPWILLDGGFASTKFGANKNGTFELFLGNRASPYTQENQIVDEIRPLAGANFAYTVIMPGKAKGPLTLKVQDVFHFANSTRAAIEWETYPNLNLFADFKLANFVPDEARAGFLFFNHQWGTELVFNYRHKFDDTTFEYDYTSLSTRGGADTLLADPNLETALGINQDAQDAFDLLSAARAEEADKKVGKQISDFENLNLLPEAVNDRFEAILSQKIAKKVFLNFEFDTRLVDATKRANAVAAIDPAQGNLNVTTVDQGELAVITDLVAEDNRFAFTYPFLEFGPGIDFYDIGLKGLHLAASAKFRLVDPNDDIDVRLLFGNDLADNQVTFFSDISGENDNTGLALTAEASQTLGNGKIRFGALVTFHQYNTVGRYVVVDANGAPLTGINGIGVDQEAGLLNLNSFSGSGWLRLKITDKIFARAAYTAETDLQFFPDDPFIVSGINGFQGGKDEFASSDIVLLQRLLFAAGINF